VRLKPGRPDIDDYADRFAVPAASSESPLSVTFLGVATLLVSDGDSAVLTDGYFSRPGLAKVGLGRVAPDRGRIDGCLRGAGITRLDGVLPVHTHFDHALDSAVVAEHTGALLVGGRSAVNVGRGGGLPEDRLREVSSGDEVALGAFDVIYVESDHCPPDRYPGEIATPLTPPAKAAAYRCGEAWSLLVDHRPSGRSLLVQGSAGFVPGALEGRSAEVVYLGVGQLGLLDERYLRGYWNHTVTAVGARRVVLIHWDDFFRPLDRPLRALPYAGDDLDVTMRVLGGLAEQDGVDLWLPQVWRAEDPWAGLTT
jgi:L-ascorbate metabolism protein UlaG (beta-lactamase superfamily)